MQYIITVISILLFLVTTAHSQTINGTSGTFSHGNTVTISGSSFGSHGDYHTASNSGLAFAWENFENVSAFSNGTAITSGFAPDCNTSDCNQDWMVGTTGNRTNSSKWARRIDLHDSFACNVHGLKKPLGSGASYGNVAFVSYWFKVPHTSSSGKVYRQWSSSNATNDLGYWSTGGPSGYTIRAYGYNADGVVLGDATWQRIDWIQTSSTHLDIYILGANGNAPEESGALAIEGGSGSNGYFQAVLGSGKDYGTNTSTDYYGYDDVYISFTQARVELCNTATWSARSVCEVQIPTSWSASSIQIAANTGAFTNGQTAYLYVVNSSGTASNPQTITIDGTGGGDVTNPTVAITTINGESNTSDTYATSSSTVTLAGTATDAVGVTSLTWSNNRGGSGSATCTGCPGTSVTWAQNAITLLPGVNVLTITARDAAGNSSTDTLTVTYIGVDTTPSQFTFTDIGNATRSTVYTSNTITVTGLDGTAAVSITGGTYSKNGGVYTSSAGTAFYGDTFAVRHTSSSSYATAVNTVLTIGGVSDTYTTTTIVDPGDVIAPVCTITSPTSSPTYATATGTITVSGTASDAVGVTSVTWANDRGGSGTATGTTSWSQANIVLYPGVNVITITARDAAANAGIDTITVTYTPADSTAPVISITTPTSDPTYSTSSAIVNIAGTASDAVGVVSVGWTNDRGGVGTCTGTTSWSQSNIVLYSGVNILTITARDAANNAGTDTLTVTYTPVVTEQSTTTLKGIIMRGVKRH